ncbi:MAG TPA: uroporphyrinogen decarboxylase family protein [Armatimonadota bacterium]|nr:uroporphyrinogen decarboxylase family protein [Armatimonadota bacterium]HOS42382.1 uroporphyrinogen decarboxylase family protein [Armatimonadota bacterium]
MRALTSFERMDNTLRRKPIDCVACYDAPWGETTARWRAEGHMGAEEDVCDALDMDMRSGGWINSIANLDVEPEVLDETEETILTRDGNGAMLRQHKQHASTPEHVGFTVADRRGWEEWIKPHLLELDRRRVPVEIYRAAKRDAAARQRYFVWWGIAPFEQMHPMCGHENLLAGMAEDPDWVREMVMTYARFTLMHLETLVAEAGAPDAFFFGEDMGFKGKPFMSPAMYRAIMQPGHALLFSYAHSLNRPVIVHSCGYVEPLVPGLIEAGMDCLQALEVKAGMDMRRLREQHGDAIAYFGNMDVRALLTNDRARIDAELEEKLPAMLGSGGRYILMSDHSIPPQVDFPTMQYFFARGREISRRVLGTA